MVARCVVEFPLSFFPLLKVFEFRGTLDRLNSENVLYIGRKSRRVDNLDKLCLLKRKNHKKVAIKLQDLKIKAEEKKISIQQKTEGIAKIIKIVQELD